MKKSLILLSAAIMLLAGCTNEWISDIRGGKTTPTTFSVQMDNGSTRAAVDGDGAAAKVNRCIMEVYYGDELFTRMYAPVIDKKASFTTQVVSNRTYTVVFWADHVDNPTGENQATDKYYDTSNGLTAISLKGTYVGNDDARDAFFCCQDYTVVQGGSNFDATLTRPFAQVNVITTDWEKAAKNTGLAPDNVTVTLKNPMVNFNAVTGVATPAATAADLTYTAAIYTNPASSVAEATLSMDYLFASATKEVIDIDWVAKKDGNSDVNHSFTSVPYQRNYRTNIKGELLTTVGQWNITVDPIWSVPDEEVYKTVIDNIAALNDVLASEKAKAVNEVIVTTTMPTDSDSKEVVFTTANNDQVVSLTFEGTLGTNNTITFKNDSETTTEGPANLNIVAPAGTKLVFNNPLTHVVINGTSYENISGTFSANSLIIEKDVTVNNLEIAAGGLEIHGTVNNVTVTGTAATVFVRDCEGLSDAVYNVLKDYIAEGYEAKQNGSKWDIVATNWIHFAAKSFSKIDGTDITIMSSEEMALLGKNVNEGTTYAGYTVKLGCDIDLAAYNWTPMATSIDKCFKGTFDGQNHTISNVKISGTNAHVSFFGTSYGPVIKNITFDKANVSGGDNACVVVGYSARVQNVTVKNSTLTGKERVGAISGGGYVSCKDCTVDNCTITGTEQVAAVAGYMCGIEGSGNTVKNCTITASVDRAAGVFGKIEANDNGTTAGYIWSNNKVEKTTVTAPEWVGGVASQIMGGYGEYQIKGNTIDATLTQTSGSAATSHLSPIGALRVGQPVVFTSKLEANITGNTWTTTTYAENSFIYSDAETKAGDQTIWNGEPANIWTNYAAQSFSSIDESNKIINITTAAELALVAKTLNSGKAPGNGSYYYAGWKVYLANAIDLAGHDWVPIGDNGHMFFGAFDGKGYTISNMTITTDYKRSGLFGCVQSTDGFDGAYFGNVVFDKAVVKSNTDGATVGVFAGGYNRPINKVTVKNSTVESIKYVGAIIGENYGKITECTVENTTVKGLRVGGIAGLFAGLETSNCVLKGTTTLTRTNDNDSEMGGFFARTMYAETTRTVSGCTIYNTVKINGENVSDNMVKKGTSSPYLGSCVGRDYDNMTDCTNNTIGATN